MSATGASPSDRAPEAARTRLARSSPVTTTTPTGLSGRANPGLGVFETMLVRDHRAVRVERHMARLSDSVAALYGVNLPEDTLERVRCAARAGEEGGVLRVSAKPQLHGVAVELELGPPRSRSLPIELVPVQCPGGLGAHKWLDRRWIDRASSDRGTPLLIDGNGCVLEAAFGNVFIEREGALLTPPATGQLLPGVTRAALIAAARANKIAVIERQMTLDEALASQRLFITSALAGAAPAVLPGGSARADGARARALTQLLAPPSRA